MLMSSTHYSQSAICSAEPPSNLADHLLTSSMQTLPKKMHRMLARCLDMHLFGLKNPADQQPGDNYNHCS